MKDYAKINTGYSSNAVAVFSQRYISSSVGMCPASHDDFFPRQEYRRTFDTLLEKLSDRQACKTMVELLALAHDRGCERELAEQLADTLDEGGLPDMAVLRAHFSPDPARLPNVSVQLASLSGYEALIGGAHEVDTAGEVA